MSQKSEIKREWRLFDAKGKILGRLATEIALALTGKGKVNYIPNLDTGDSVVVVNAALVKVTGNKLNDKIYYRYTGYPGGLRARTYKEQMAKDPRKIITHAVSGMLPKNKLRDRRLARLKVYADDKHPYANIFSQKD